MTPVELQKLLAATRERPLREASTNTGGRRPDGTPKTAVRVWTADLQPETQQRYRLLGRERALLYKTAVLTGLRQGELVALRVAFLQLDRKEAIEAAKALIGRNAIHRATGIPSGSVSKSATYRQHAAEFHLGRDGPALDKSKAIGLDIAIEEKAVCEDDPVVEEVARREAAEFVRPKLGEDDAAELLLGQIESGSISPDGAIEFARAMLDHKDDTRTGRKSR